MVLDRDTLMDFPLTGEMPAIGWKPAMPLIEKNKMAEQGQSDAAPGADSAPDAPDVKGPHHD